ncbi:hypothetical protein [Granulicella mallensis]|uniref:Uncharacterized protein n=1 Tax=Granulicella mallensis TaxID=940614 RepID=A0A7W8E909_9BACT|nr:hypothetical protein [Granulicella mallensis]MBB5063302.1 hypothetical protein [Granulicella mallensis]
MDKEALIRTASTQAIDEIARVLRIEPTQNSVTPALKLAMGSDLMKAYKLSLYFGLEADRCFDQKAFFASCLLTAAANEAFLTLTCIQEEQAVMTTSIYRGLKKPSKTFRETIADLSLDKLIKISNELGWIPNDVVNPELLEAVIQDFPKLAETVYPNWNAAQVAQKVEAFRRAPGPEMLKVMQDMRNLVHATRWLKTGSLLDDTEFESNCKLAVIVGREVVLCFSLRSTRTFEANLQKLGKFEELPESVKARVRELLLSDIQGTTEEIV